MSNLIIEVRVVKDEIGLDYTASIEMTDEEVANSSIESKFDVLVQAALRKIHNSGIIK